MTTFAPIELYGRQLVAGEVSGEDQGLDLCIEHLTSHARVRSPRVYFCGLVETSLWDVIQVPLGRRASQDAASARVTHRRYSGFSKRSAVLNLERFTGGAS